MHRHCWQIVDVEVVAVPLRDALQDVEESPLVFSFSYGNYLGSFNGFRESVVRNAAALGYAYRAKFKALVEAR